MAQRRMFSKTITNSSQFLMMPQSSQNLYFHLGMNADDDGFCEHFTIMRMTDSKPDDLKILQAKGFVNIFDDRVLVILQRKENNYIQKDRYTKSKYLEVYKEELEKLGCIQNVYKMETQVRLELGKESIDNSISSKPKETSLEGFDIFWKMYPHTHKGKKKEAKKYFEKLDVIEVMYEIKFINRLITFGLQDPQYMPACERWIRDFTPTADIVKEQNIKKIVNKLMQMEIGDKRKEYASQLKSDFGEDIISKYVKERNVQTNGISLQFNK